LNWPEQSVPPEPKTLAHAEYEHILKILKETDWVVGGPRGAANKLGLKRTTLICKMRKLGLARSKEAMDVSRSSVRDTSFDSRGNRNAPFERSRAA